MRKFLLLLMLVMCGSVAAMSQHRYTIERCWQMAKDNFPNIKSQSLTSQCASYSLANANNEVYPNRVVYKSAPTVGGDRSKIGNNHIMNLISGDANPFAGSTNKESYSDSELVFLGNLLNNIYFSTILIDKKIMQVEVTMVQMYNVESAIRGMKTTTERINSYLAKLDVYKLELNHRVNILRSIYSEYINVLSALMGVTVSERDILIEPDIKEFLDKGSLSILDILEPDRNASLINANVVQSSSIVKLINDDRLDISKLPTLDSRLNVDSNAAFDKLRKQLFNIDTEKYRDNYKAQIDRLVYEINSTNKSIEAQVDIITIGYGKLEKGSESIDVFLRKIKQFDNLQHQQIGYLVQLMLEANQYRALY